MHEQNAKEATENHVEFIRSVLKELKHLKDTSFDVSLDKGVYCRLTSRQRPRRKCFSITVGSSDR